MRLVFLGSGEFGLPTLETLVSRGHEVYAVVTQPDRPAGRGGKKRATPVRTMAERLEIPVYSPEKPNTPEFEAVFAGFEPDLAVVVAYGHLIRKTLLSIPRLGFVNLHASLLPAYRGAAPVPWAILNGETVSGVSVFRLDERFDTGAVVATASLPIAPDDTSESYLARLAPVGGALMADAVDALAAGASVARPQDGAGASSAPKLRKEDGIIDWSRPWAEIERKVRAFQPWPHAFTMLRSSKGLFRVNVLAMEPAGCEMVSEPGVVITADVQNGLVLMAGDCPVRLSRLQPEGKRPMSDIEFLRGTRIEP